MNAESPTWNAIMEEVCRLALLEAHTFAAIMELRPVGDAEFSQFGRMLILDRASGDCPWSRFFVWRGQHVLAWSIDPESLRIATTQRLPEAVSLHTKILPPDERPRHLVLAMQTLPPKFHPKS